MTDAHSLAWANMTRAVGLIIATSPCVVALSRDAAFIWKSALKEHQQLLASLKVYLNNAIEEHAQAMDPQGHAAAHACRGRLLATKFEVTMLTIWKTTIGKVQRRFSRTEKLMDTWSSDHGQVDDLVPGVWCTAQAIVEAGKPQGD